MHLSQAENSPYKILLAVIVFWQVFRVRMVNEGDWVVEPKPESNFSLFSTRRPKLVVRHCYICNGYWALVRFNGFIRWGHVHGMDSFNNESK